MSNATETKTQAYHQLATYLRRNPEAVNHSSSELAERFGLPEDVVHGVQALVRDRSARRAAEGQAGPSLVKPTVALVHERMLQPVVRSTCRKWLAWTARPAWFVGVSTGVGIVASFALKQYQGNLALPATDFRIWGISAALVFIIVTLQLMCYFRHGMARHAFYGALINWVLASTSAIVINWIDADKSDPVRAALMILAIPLLLLVGSAAYAGVGFVFAVFGGYRQMRRAESQRERLGRQQLLERLFEIEERLRLGPTGHQEAVTILDHPYVQLVRRHPKTSAVVLGLGLGLLYVIPAGLLRPVTGTRGATSAFSIVDVVEIVIVFAWVFAQACIGFLAGRTMRALVSCAIFAVCAGLPMMIPIGEYGPAHFLAASRDMWLGLGVLTMAIAIVSSLGAAVEDRAARERRLRHNDPATLLAEMLDIQFVLTPSSSLVCIMVVDAARSADMKAAADPLVVEYSFREYQRLIQDISERFGGTVHSTAGDGAVVAFPSCTEAFAAAKRIQTDIDDFNRESNRLRSPFRLRIGLHVGRVAGELEKVQFTEVIDIAAHVQAIAPVGGIAMTELVSQQLGGEPAVQLKDPVDGHTVMLVLNPTVDQ